MAINPIIRMAYISQKHSAKKRGIGWQFTLDTWLAWWGDDILLRGRTADSLVMGRIGDVGPYSPDNTYKCSLSENFKHAFINNPSLTDSLRTRIKTTLQSKQSQQKAALSRCKLTHTPLGTFNSIDAAAKAHGVSRNIIGNRLKSNQAKYAEYYLQK